MPLAPGFSGLPLERLRHSFPGGFSSERQPGHEALDSPCWMPSVLPRALSPWPAGRGGFLLVPLSEGGVP